MDLNLTDFPPPVLYDFPYTGSGVVLTLPLDRAETVCRALGVRTKNGDRIYGCSMWTVGGCLIVLPKVEGRMTKQNQDDVHRIESANCNGQPRGNRE